jgi:hypothetical protein
MAMSPDCLLMLEITAQVYVSLGGNLARDDDQASGGQGLTGDSTGRVFGQAGVQDGVGNLVCDLVRMAFRDRFGRKKITVLG